MKKYLIISIILFFTTSFLNAQLTNISQYQYEYLNNVFTGQVSISTQFYKFVVYPPVLLSPSDYGQTVIRDIYPGETIYIPEYIYNVGSINESYGIKITSSSPPTGITVSFNSAQNLTSILPNNTTPPIPSGNSYTYYIRVTVPLNIAQNSFSLSITNTGSTNGPPYPYKYVVNYLFNIIKRNISVARASDGIHTIEGNSLFDGSQALGNLSVKIYVKIQGNISDTSEVILYYDANGVPDGSTPDGTVNKNRSIKFVKEGDYWVATIPVVDPEIQPGNEMNFVISIDGHLYYFDDSTKTPWKYVIREYKEQQEESKYTISINNKFNPENNEKYHLIYKLNRKSFVDISIFNIRGELVRKLKHEVQDIGKYEVEWDGTNDNGDFVSMGLYLVNIQTAEYGDIRKVIVIKR